MCRKLLNFLWLTTIILYGLQSAIAQDKAELVNKLIGLTFQFHPSEMEERMAENSVDAKKYEAEERRSYAGFLTSAIKANTQLTTEQKAFAQKNLPKLVDFVAFEILVIQDRNNNSGKWLRESLEKNYSAKLTIAELKSLTDYFVKEAGKNTLNYIATSPERKKSGEPNYSPEQFLAYNDFVIKTPLGSKFFNIFVTDAQTEMASKFMAANKQMRAEMNKLYEDASLNQIINQFVNESSEQIQANKSSLANQLAEDYTRLQNEEMKQFALKLSDEQTENDKMQKENYAEIFNEALKVNKNLSADQKNFAKANYDKLGDILLVRQKALADNFMKSNELASKKALTILITKYLAVDEIKYLSTYLQSLVGKDLIKLFMPENDFSNAELEKFMQTSAGSKFLTILKKELSKAVEPATREGHQKYMEESFQLLDLPEINKLINEFVVSNYKK